VSAVDQQPNHIIQRSFHLFLGLHLCIAALGVQAALLMINSSGSMCLPVS
jgi:hypothetical protein